MVNATEMAKAFGKLPKDWLSNKSTSELISTLSAVRGIPLTELVIVKQGGSPEGQGTWMHEDVALEFARWLSPAFAIWCNDRIKELITTGEISLPKNYKEALQALLKEVENNEQLQAKIEEDKPKVEFAEAMLTCQSSCLIGELAKIITQNGYTIGQNRLFQWMRDNNYLLKSGEKRNMPKQLYVEQGLFEIKKGYRVDKNGVNYTTATTKVTVKGQQYFISRFKGLLAQKLRKI